jgi:hypothetical protein
MYINNYILCIPGLVIFHCTLYCLELLDILGMQQTAYYYNIAMNQYFINDSIDKCFPGNCDCFAGL